MDLNFEELRRQYRAEAIQACKTAEQRGYERALAEHADMYSGLRSEISRVTEECCRLEEVVERAKCSELDTGRAAALLKCSMEQVYRCLKHEFDGDPSSVELTSRFKKALRQATEITSARIKDTSFYVAAPIKTPLRYPAAQWIRPTNITLSTDQQPPLVTFACRIEGYTTKTTSSMFGSKFVSYMVSTNITTLPGEGNDDEANKSSLVNRRYSDFAAFENKLRRVLSRCILPVLPPKEMSKQTTDETVVHRRLRYLHAWLRFVAQHCSMSRLKCFGEFICDDKDTRWASFLTETLDENEVVVHSEDIRFRSRNTLLLIKRDFRQLSHHMGDALLASKRVNKTINEFRSAIQSVQGTLREVLDAEDTEAEKNNLYILHVGVEVVEELHSGFGRCMRNLADSLRFFGQPCMESAHSLLDRCGTHDPLSDGSVEIISALAREWSFLREHRHCELRGYIAECGFNMQEENRQAKNRLLAASSKVSDACPSDIVEALKHSMFTQSLYFDDVYQKLCDRVSALVRSESCTPSTLQHTERATLPSGVRRQPVKILDSIKPELNATVGELNTDYHRELSGEDDDIVASQETATIVGASSLDNGDSVVPNVGEVSQKPRNRRVGNPASNAATQSSNLRHRQHAAPRKPLPGPAPVIGTTAGSVEGSNFIAKSYGQHSTCQAPGKSSTFSDSSRSHVTARARVVSPKRARPSDAYSWGDKQYVPSRTTQSSVRTTLVSDVVGGPTVAADDIENKSYEGHSDSEDVFHAPEMISDATTGWEEVKLPDSEGGGIYYYHKKTRVSRWDRPDEAVAAAMESRLREEEQRVEQAVQKRKEERELSLKAENDKVAAHERIQAQIQTAMSKWRKPPGAVRERNVVELLKSVGDVVTLVSGDNFVNSAAIRELNYKDSSGDEVRRCYMKVVRLIHPDKISALSSNEERFVAEAAFVVLTEAYQKYAQSNPQE